MIWFLLLVVVIIVVVVGAVLRAMMREDDRQRERTAPMDADAMASVKELRERDAHTWTDAELELVLAADRADDERHARTTASIHRSEYLSPEDEARYVTVDGGMPNIRLVRERGQLAMVIPQGMVNSRSRSLARLGIFTFRARGVSHYADAILAASLSPGSKVRLVREPDNEFDPNAIAIYPGRGAGPLGYVNKQNAARLAKALDAGESFAAITLSGSPAGRDGEPLTILAAHPDVLAHMRA